VFRVEWYVDKPGRELRLVPQGARVWVDIEPGCFDLAEEVRDEGTRLTELGLLYGTYGNQGSIAGVFGASEELQNWPLWYANYGPPVPANWQPFNGFTTPELWQYDDGPYCGINVDLSIDEEGGLYADFGNYTVLTPKHADMLVATLQGAIIGLQDYGKAQWNFELLKAAADRLGKPIT